MTKRVLVTTNRKGSNPGAECTIKGVGETDHFYVKYCNRAQNMGVLHTLSVLSQPTYEVLTCEYAHLLGLHVADNLILLNGKQDVQFEYASKSLDKFNTDRPQYVISRFVQPQYGEMSVLGQILEREKLYRDLLLIHDVSGRRQNYGFIPISGAPDGGIAFYIDLGCSWVQVTDGVMRVGNKQRKGKSNGDLKRAAKFVSRHAIISNDEENIFTLEELVDMMPDMTVRTVNPLGKKRISDLLQPSEIKALQTSWLGQLPGIIAKHRDDPRVIRI